MTRQGAQVAIIDNSIDPAVYKPIDHWRMFLGVPWEAFRAAESRFPELNKKKYTHLILTGSEASILERESWVYEELEVVQEALDRRIPVLGSCYGHQLLALALRGPAHVKRCSRPEVGWIPVTIDKSSDLLGKQGKAWTFALHFDEVINLDDDFAVLASTPACGVQVFALKTQPAWGIQPHPEIDACAARELLENLIRLKPKTSSLYEAALSMKSRDSGLIRRIVRHFLSSCERP